MYRSGRTFPPFWYWVALLWVLMVPNAANARNTVALTYFDNHSGDPSFDALGHGLADMLITDLSELSTLRIVERSRLNDIMEELELSDSSFVDPTTAAQLGQGLGATLIVTGSFTTIAPQMRIDARVVDVASGEIAFSTEVTGPQEEFFLLEKELALALAEQAGATISFREQARMGNVATESFDAFAAWSTSLEAIDQADFIKAKDAIDRALQADDSFSAAMELRNQLEELLTEYEGKRDEIMDQQQTQAMTRLRAIAAAGGPYEEVAEIVNFNRILSDYKRFRDHKEMVLLVLSMELPETYRYMKDSINEVAIYTVHHMSDDLVQRSDALAYGELYLKRYPGGRYAESVAHTMRSIKNQIVEEQRGAQKVPGIRHEGQLDLQRRRCKLTGGAATATQRLPACKEWLRLAQEGADEDQIQAALTSTASCAREASDEKTLAKLDRQFPHERDVENSLSRLRDLKEKAKKEQELTPESELSERLKVIDHLLKVHRVDQANALLDEAIERWPENPKLHELRFRRSELLGDLGQMEADRQALITVAQIAYQAEEAEIRCENTRPPSAAEPFCQDLLNRLDRIGDESTHRSEIKRAYEGAGTALMHMGDLAGLEALTKRYPNTTLERWQHNLSKAQTAIQELGPAVLSPTDAEQARAYAMLLQEAGDLERAAALLNQANQQWPEDLDLWEINFKLRLLLNDDAGAEIILSAYERALEPVAEAYIAQRTESVGAEKAQRDWNNRYAAKLPDDMREKLADMREQDQRLADLSENSTDSVVSSYQTPLRRKDFAQRIEVLRGFPNDWAQTEPQALHSLARELVIAYQHQAAAEIFVQILEEHPHFELIEPPNLVYSAAVSYHASGQLPEAIAMWERIINEFPNCDYFTSAEHSLNMTPR